MLTCDELTDSLKTMPETRESQNPFDRLSQLGPPISGEWCDGFFGIVRSLVVERFQHRIPAKLQSFLSSEDLAQDAAMKLLDRIRSDGPPQHLTPAYVMVVAQNLLVDHLRRHLADKRAPKEGFADITPRSSANLLNDISGKDKTPSHITALHEVWPVIISYLTEREQEIVELRFAEELTTSEIASLLNTSNAAIRSILCRIRARLREELMRRPEFESYH